MRRAPRRPLALHLVECEAVRDDESPDLFGGVGGVPANEARSPSVGPGEVPEGGDQPSRGGDRRRLAVRLISTKSRTPWSCGRRPVTMEVQTRGERRGSTEPAAPTRPRASSERTSGASFADQPVDGAHVGAVETDEEDAGAAGRAPRPEIPRIDVSLSGRRPTPSQYLRRRCPVP